MRPGKKNLFMSIRIIARWLGYLQPSWDGSAFEDVIRTIRHYLFPRPIKAFWGFFCIFLTACTATPDLTSIQAHTALQPLQVSITPALQRYGPTLKQCAQTQPNIALFIQEIPAASIDSVKSDLQLRLGLPNQGVDYAFQVGEKNLQIIVNAKKAVHSVSSDQIRALFNGKIADWEGVLADRGAVHPWVYPESNELEQIFERFVMEGGYISPTASIATDPNSMLQAVAKDEGAIGFLPSSWLTDTVHALGLDHNLAKQLNIPILALTQSQPQGSLGIFIACLQENGKSGE
jgi:hypothetical protein